MRGRDQRAGEEGGESSAIGESKRGKERHRKVGCAEGRGEGASQQRYLGSRSADVWQVQRWRTRWETREVEKGKNERKERKGKRKKKEEEGREKEKKLGEVVIDGALGQEVVREHVPLAARAGLIAEGVEDLAHVDLARPPARLGGRDERLEDLPLSVGQIGRIGLTHRWIGGYAKGWTPVPTGIIGPNWLSG